MIPFRNSARRAVKGAYLPEGNGPIRAHLEREVMAPVYVAFDGDKDKWAYAFMKGWKTNERVDFDFEDAHDLDAMTGRAQSEGSSFKVPPTGGGVTKELLESLGMKVLPPPAKFTAEGLRARGFKVPEPRGEGFIIPMGGPIWRKP